ncbi:hypothetical protein F53441_4839 [Fusarium austroafricanum]|uniref:Uncharacterized protein n=1 Tax=Fusarium austroafricanum TaxID=2364996 RepID=A0A8H4KM38_9HYPO|nr:hypothetical protein F53441_4839 [Fusarium austroafricanum]
MSSSRSVSKHPNASKLIFKHEFPVKRFSNPVMLSDVLQDIFGTDNWDVQASGVNIMIKVTVDTDLEKELERQGILLPDAPVVGVWVESKDYMSPAVGSTFGCLCHTLISPTSLRQLRSNRIDTSPPIDGPLMARAFTSTNPTDRNKLTLSSRDMQSKPSPIPNPTPVRRCNAKDPKIGGDDSSKDTNMEIDEPLDDQNNPSYNGLDPLACPFCIRDPLPSFTIPGPIPTFGSPEAVPFRQGRLS